MRGSNSKYWNRAHYKWASLLVTITTYYIHARNEIRFQNEADLKNFTCVCECEKKENTWKATLAANHCVLQCDEDSRQGTATPFHSFPKHPSVQEAWIIMARRKTNSTSMSVFSRFWLWNCERLQKFLYKTFKIIPKI